MKEIIDWCNSNNGFVSAVLSSSTILVSLIAIGISVRTARLPYKKKIKIVTGSYISNDEIGIHITVTNIGNRNIIIKRIGYILGEKICVSKKSLTEPDTLLKQGETISEYFSQSDICNSIKNSNVSNNYTINAVVEDSEGKKYKKRIAKVKDFF